MTVQHTIHPKHDVRELAQLALARNSCFGGRHVSVEMDEDRLILRGAVRTYYQKQMAQESVRGFPGINEIRNEIEVISV